MSAADAERAAAMYDLDNDAAASAGGPGTADIDWFRAIARRVGGPILELGCGTGRIAVALALDGHRVVGIERSAAMIERARRRAGPRSSAEFRQGDIRAFELGDSFRLVAMALNTFLALEPGDRRSCLSSARAHLAADGRLALDVFQPEGATAGGEGVVVEEWTRSDPATGHEVTKFTSSRATSERTVVSLSYDELDADGTVRRLHRRTALHHLYRREAELLFASEGLAIESIHGDYDGSPAEDDARRLLIVARAVTARARRGRCG